MPVGTSGVPTPKCVCERRRSFNVSAENGRLYELGSYFGEIDDPEQPNGKELLEPVVAPWPCLGGGPDRQWAAVSRRRLRLIGGTGVDVEPTLLRPVDTPATNYPIGAVLFANGRVIYAHGPKIRSYWPGLPNADLTLDGAIPKDNWRLLVVASRLFVALQNRVQIIDLVNWAVLSAFDGAYSSQSMLGDLWVGVRTDANNTVVEFRDAAGAKAADSVKIPGADSLDFVSTGTVGYLGFRSGRVHRFERSSDTACSISTSPFLEPLGAGADSVLAIALSQHGLVRLVRKDSVLEARLTEDSGNTSVLRLRISATTSNPVILGDRIYFIDAADSAIEMHDLSTRAYVGRAGLAAQSNVVWASGVAHGRKHFIALAVANAAGQGQVILLDPDNNQTRQLAVFSQGCDIDVIFAEGRPVVATSIDFENRIRIFELFDS